MAFESRARNGNRDDVSRLKPRNDASKDSRKEVNLVPEDGYDGAHEVDWLKKHHMRKRKESNKNKRPPDEHTNGTKNKKDSVALDSKTLMKDFLRLIGQDDNMGLEKLLSPQDLKFIINKAKWSNLKEPRAT
ncbi:uncharacterized protein LOC142339151 isoform X2 [Convolutriloba macropyga]|uniref:uncharacterized protein LOC142339151 isoform X2 n=1 Tax=Convolutriloba macropyga TaxID=536237 RepID=UPI003F51EC46